MSNLISVLKDQDYYNYVQLYHVTICKLITYLYSLTLQTASNDVYKEIQVNTILSAYQPRRTKLFNIIM
jgi:hypothetical protein